MGELFAEQCQTIADMVVTSIEPDLNEYQFNKKLPEGELHVILYDFSYAYPKMDMFIRVYDLDGNGWRYQAHTTPDGNWLSEPMDAVPIMGLLLSGKSLEGKAATENAEKKLQPICDLLLSEEIDEEQLQ